ncbi:hypothetical protein [Radiobacillus sp. PE A8.2]|uniref:hypothetical protein n=1 Tax=Radiobacillus sp. PE A8.2 TaxID=3380349 RepID=UPI0038905DC0
MTKKLEAYFKNEDDAETVHAELNRFNVSNVSVEEIPEGDERFLVPIFPINNSGSSGGGGLVAGLGEFGEPTQTDQRRHLLSFEIEEKDFQEALNIVKKSEGYIAKDS